MRYESMSTCEYVNVCVCVRVSFVWTKKKTINASPIQAQHTYTPTGQSNGEGTCSEARNMNRTISYDYQCIYTCVLWTGIFLMITILHVHYILCGSKPHKTKRWWSNRQPTGKKKHKINGAKAKPKLLQPVDRLHTNLMYVLTIGSIPYFLLTREPQRERKERRK